MTRSGILLLLFFTWACSSNDEPTSGESSGGGGLSSNEAGPGGTSGTAPDESEAGGDSTGGNTAMDPSDDDTPGLERRCDAFAGPDGSHWPPSTPQYTEAATLTLESLTQLNGALANASSGDVIEIMPGKLEESLTLSAGQESWAENVLIRPIAGHRGEVEIAAGLTITSPRLTLAGFTVSSSVVMREGADRSFLARSVLTKNAVVIANDTFDSGWYELVATEPRAGGDRAQVKASSGKTSRGFVAAGLWFKGAYREIGSSDHSDTLQLVGVSGGEVQDVTLLDSVLWPSANAALQIGETTGTQVVHSWLAPCGGFSDDVPDGFECGGYHAMQGGESNEVHESVVNGVLKGSDPYASVTESHIGGFALEPLHEADNTIEVGIHVDAPALCSLAEIWGP